MKFLITLFITFLFISSHSQQLYFPASQLKDSATIQSSMAQLANQLIKIHKEEEGKDVYLDDLTRFEMVAEEYQQALLTLDSLRAIYKSDPVKSRVRYFSFEVFAKVKLYQAEKNKPFAESFKIVFSDLYSKLNEIQTIKVGRSFDIQTVAYEKSFQNLLEAQKNKDSIDFKVAKELCGLYSTFNFFKQMIPLTKLFLKDAENRLYIIEDSVQIKTRDGSTIQAIVIRNRGFSNPLPVVLNFNIYIGESDKDAAKTSAMNGYIGIVANTRGKGLSPQKIEPFEQDANDAYDIIDWISKQPWCNGKVGMYGGSYLGFSQWAATKNIHPALKTIVPQVSVGIGIDYPMQNNVFMSYMLRWIHLVTNNKQNDQADFAREKHWNSTFTNWYKKGASFKSLDSFEGRKSEIFQRWLQHPSYDSFWYKMVPYKNDFSKINIPILTITGYFDDDQLGAFYYYKEHLKYNVNANHTLLIGPYDHAGSQGTPSSEWQGYTIDSVANINITDIVYNWFDYTLKDSTKPALLIDKVNYEVMGTNTWKHTSSLSAMNNDTLQFFFSNIPSGKYFKLDSQKPNKKEFIKQEVNFLTRNDTSDFSDEKVLSKIPESGEYISFISDAFENPISINSNFFGEVKTIINKKDYDLNIRLYELLPDGTFFNLSHFLGRASYAKDRSKRQLLTPGKEETIPYSNSFLTSKQLSKGSRLIVLVGINKNKYWQVNYGSGKDVSDETILDGKEPLQIQWFNDSYIKVPVWRDSSKKK